VMLAIVAYFSIPLFAFGVALFVSVAIHEFAHAAVATRLGHQVNGMMLHFMGGGTFIEEFMSRDGVSPSSEAKICAAGPLANLALGLCTFAYLIPINNQFMFYVVNYIGFFGLLNIFLAVYNFFPAWPLDGGRILHAVANHFFKDNLKATKICAVMGVMFGFTMVMTGALLGAWGWIIIGAFGIMLTTIAYAAFLQLDDNCES